MTRFHDFPVRMYYEDTDAGGIVYHANYLKFMERARNEMMRDLGLPIAELAERDGLLFVVGDAHVRYKAPARLDDLLTVRSAVKTVGGASLALQQNIFRQSPGGVAKDERLLLEGVITLVMITRDGRPFRLPQPIRDALASYVVTED